MDMMEKAIDDARQNIEPGYVHPICCAASRKVVV